MPIWHATPRVGLSFRFGLSVIAAVASQTARPYAKA